MKASDSYRIKLGACAALAVMTLTSGAALAIGIASLTPLPVLAEFGVGSEGRADAAAASPETPLVEAAAADRAAIAAAPLSAAAWLRLAYISSRDGRPLDAEALDAIERSYSVAPFGADVTAWRLTFLYDHWGELTPEIRAEAVAEHLAMVGNQLPKWTPDAITNPAGRMAATFTHAHALTLQAKNLAKKQ